MHKAIPCNTCGKEIHSAYPRNCMACYRKSQIGKVLPHLQNKGRTRFSKGFTPWNKGKQHLVGEKNPAWKGGVTRGLQNWRRFINRGISNDITILIQRIYEENIKTYGTLTCSYCKKDISFGKDTIDHKVPLSRGGLSNYHNLTIACFSCNSGKRNLTEAEYFAKKEGSSYCVPK